MTTLIHRPLAQTHRHYSLDVPVAEIAEVLTIILDAKVDNFQIHNLKDGFNIGFSQPEHLEHTIVDALKRRSILKELS